MTTEPEPATTKLRAKVPAGSGLTPYGMFLLAQEFQRAGDFLNERRLRRNSDNPIRLLYYQALEGYMRAFLRLRGKQPKEIRAYGHDFGKMLEDCQAAGLSVRPKTAAFVKETFLDSDYVRVRYDDRLVVPEERVGPGTPGKELTRLVSATVELQMKTRAALIESGIFFANP